jgi:DNA polymerase elongation subunit (family B)
MIIEMKQRRDNVDISYVNTENQISIEQIWLNDGYYKYVECNEDDPNKLDLRSFFNNSCIKKEDAKYFTHHNVNEFICYDLPTNYPQQNDLFLPLRLVNPFSCDIETDVTEEFGYSNQTDVENSVRSIQITDINLNTIVYIVKNPKYSSFNDLDINYIEKILQDALKHYYDKHEYKFKIQLFDTEVEMLDTFFISINKYFHLLIGWNFLDFDWRYLVNRAIKLGIDVRKASPTKSTTKKSIEINDKTTIDFEVPSHRVIMDYMFLFKESLVYNNLGGYSLNDISELILNLQKVEYDGNLRTLYETDYLRFIAYAIIDPILTMLIHKETNLMTVDFFQSFYTKIPYTKLSQNSISEALIYNTLRKHNIFHLESEILHKEKRKYRGAYVKSPTKKIVEAAMGEDFGSLYPNTMITLGLSPEAKVDKVIVDQNTFLPIDKENQEKWDFYIKKGYCIAPTGTVYDVSKDYLYTEIEKGLLSERKVFKGYMTDIDLKILPKIEQEIIKRKIEKNLIA